MTVDELLYALQESNLLSEDHLADIDRETARFGDDADAVEKYLVKNDHVTYYQLGKVLANRPADLFVGPYVLLDRLGVGGMGRVYKARCWRFTRDVALKVVRPDLFKNPVIKGRYDREVAVGMAVRHPNLVAVYEAGSDNPKRHFMAMEFVDGIDLARIVKDHGKLLVPEACEYVRQACLGLHHLHEAGYVHRDVKPSNILVSGERHTPESSGSAFVKLTDLGLVRKAGPSEHAPDNTALTREKTAVGTPDYMSPEQARNSSTVDRRSDVYSLGGTLFYLLTGRPPFPDGLPVEKLFKHQLEIPPSVRDLRPDVPEPLARFVAGLLAKHPEERPPDALAVATALVPFTRYDFGSKRLEGYPILLPGAPSAGGSGGSSILGDQSSAQMQNPPADDSMNAGMPAMEGFSESERPPPEGRPRPRPGGKKGRKRAVRGRARRRRKNRHDGGGSWRLVFLVGVLAALAVAVWLVRR